MLHKRSRLTSANRNNLVAANFANSRKIRFVPQSFRLVRSEQLLHKFMKVKVRQGQRFLKKTTFRPNSLSPLAKSSIIAESSNNVILITVCTQDLCPADPFGEIAPLTVRYSEKYSSVGLMPPGINRRDQKMTTKDILISRLIDRCLRPLVSPLINKKIEINCDVLSLDSNADAQTIAINGSMFALKMAGIPLLGTCASVRVGCVSSGSGSSFQLLKNQQLIDESQFNLTVASNVESNILMMEGYANKLMNSSSLLTCIHKAVGMSSKLAADITKYAHYPEIDKKAFYSISKEQFNEFSRNMAKNFTPEVNEDLFNSSLLKEQFILKSKELKEKAKVRFLEEFPNNENIFDLLFSKFSRNSFQNHFLESNKRIDGRDKDELRPLSCSVGILKYQHGSALFSRGLSKVLTNVTLGSNMSSLAHEDAMSNYLLKNNQNFFLHYDFPSFCNGEVTEPGAALLKRREIGHGNLAHKAIVPVIEDDQKFTIRASAKVLSSNGSTSMAAVCSAVAGLNNAGVELKETVAGIAIGLVSKKPNDLYEMLTEQSAGDCENEAGDHNNKHSDVILSDITGIEDALGDIDFKIASTANDQVTALQLDVKSPTGIDLNTTRLALENAVKKNKEICQVIDKACAEKPANVERKENYPVITKYSLPHDCSVLSVLNKQVLKELMQKSGSVIDDISEDKNTGQVTINIFSPDKQKSNLAVDVIENSIKSKTLDLEKGAIYMTKIIESSDNGITVQIDQKHPNVFVNISLKKLNSKLACNSSSEKRFYEGGEIALKFIGLDPINGNPRFSHEAIFMPDSNYLVRKVQRAVQSK